MTSSDGSAYLKGRFPLAFELRFVTANCPDGDPFPSLSLLLAAATVPESGSIAFVYPRSTNVAASAAALTALSLVGEDFQAALENFKRQGLAQGQRVAVQPTEHVYEYDGFFDDRTGRFATQGIRLKILDPKKSDWRRSVVTERTVRWFPADEIARLKPTDRLVPRGKQNTNLGDWSPSPLDRLIGLRSGGNSALFRNRVLLLSSRAELDHFLETVTIARPGFGSAPAHAVLTSGSIAEGGILESDDRFQASDQPLVAVTHLVERLADACEHAVPNSRCIFVDGAGGLVRNFQAFDSITARQRLIVIADHEDGDSLTELAARGCRIWPLSEREVFVGITAPGVSCEGLFGEVKRSARNASRLRVEALAAEDEPVDRAAAELARASAALGHEKDEGIRRPVGRAFGALLELASWFGPPTAPDLAAFLERLQAILAEAQRLGPWAPPEVRDGVGNAIAHMARGAAEPLVGWSKLETLVLTLDALNANGRQTGIAARSAAAAAALRGHLPEYLRSTPVFGATLVPPGLDVDTVIVASWLKTEAMSRLLNLYLASDVKLVASSFEREWLAGLERKRRASRRWGVLDGSTKASLLGLPDESDLLAIPPDAESMATPPTLGPSHGDSDASSPATQLAHAENWAKRKAKDHLVNEADEHDRREARYVGFVGRTYAYVTSGRALPVVTDLVRGLAAEKAKVPLMTIDRLRPGEYVLFRDHGERDVISLFAEHFLGSTRYRETRAVADRWKRALSSLGRWHWQIVQRLREAGVSKHSATIRSWVLDTDKIGPGSREDVEIIAKAAGESTDWAKSVWEAIAIVRGAHIAAGQRLSQFLLSELPKQLRTASDAETFVDLTLVQAWVVEIEEIGEIENRSYTEVNRLLWD